MKLEMLHPTDIHTGLKTEDVKLNKTNTKKEMPSQSYKDIIFEHVFTLFNGINVFLFVLVCLTKSYKNGLFMGVVLINLAIGIIQSIRSKRMLDRLTLLNQKKARVIRDSQMIEIDVEKVVVNDIVSFGIGNQIPFDCILVDGILECNESNLTGESEPIIKRAGDTLFSASYVVSGYGLAQVMRVQEDSYAYSIIQEARQYKKYPSDLRDGMEKIVRICTFLLIPCGVFLFFKQIQTAAWQSAVLSTVAAVIGMIPSGLVLLTSIALAVGTIRLGKNNILIKELYCQETLARVDTICLDKTGTITEGIMKVTHVDVIGNHTLEEVKEVLGRIYGTVQGSNSTAFAIRDYVDCVTCEYKKMVPFSSSRKGLGIQFEEDAFVCGSYTNLFNELDEKIIKKINIYASHGDRVLVVAKTDCVQDNLQGNHELMAIICIRDKIKENAKETLEYFKKQGVDIKVISGDDAATISFITQKVGLNYQALNLSDDEIPDFIEKYQAFGRVKPEQKREIIKELKKEGHIVAMIGDGVNDILALKEADCSITFKNGSEACQNIASIVLLDNQFEALPLILKQGRNVINNIEKSASLFLVKTLFSFGLTIVTLFFLSNYPFIPIQLTLISALTVGIPGFILSLEPNDERVTGEFLKKIFIKAIPGALCVVLTVITSVCISDYLQMTSKELSTVSLLLTAWSSFSVLAIVCWPFTKIRSAMMILLLTIFVLAIGFFPNLFNEVILSMPQYVFCGIMMVLIFIVQMALQKILVEKKK